MQELGKLTSGVWSSDVIRNDQHFITLLQLSLFSSLSTDLDLCFILNATGKNGKEDFTKMISCIKYIIGRIGVSSVNYCVISFKKGKAFQHVTFDNKVSFGTERGRVVFKNDRGHLIRKLESLNPPKNCSPALHDDLEQAYSAFNSDEVQRRNSKKVEMPL